MIDSIDKLRSLYPMPKERALRKQMADLDPHARHFIERSPFVVIASAGHAGMLDASPRGGAPGFIKIVDPQTLHIADESGNNRLDTLTNIIETGRVGLIFLIPGIDETLRINGAACLRDDADCLAAFANERRTPRLVIEVAVREAYLHCAKAFMRSRLWSAESQAPTRVVPTMGKMISDQIGGPMESQEAMLARYAADL